MKESIIAVAMGLVLTDTLLSYAYTATAQQNFKLEEKEKSYSG